MATISFKVSDDEARAIRARARLECLTVSAFLWRQAMVVARPLTAIGRVRCPLTGAIIFDGAEDLPPLTVDSMRELLSDFP